MKTAHMSKKYILIGVVVLLAVGGSILILLKASSPPIPKEICESYNAGDNRIENIERKLGSPIRLAVEDGKFVQYYRDDGQADVRVEIEQEPGADHSPKFKTELCDH